MADYAREWIPTSLFIDKRIDGLENFQATFKTECSEKIDHPADSAADVRYDFDQSAAPRSICEFEISRSASITPTLVPIVST